MYRDLQKKSLNSSSKKHVGAGINFNFCSDLLSVLSPVFTTESGM